MLRSTFLLLAVAITAACSPAGEPAAAGGPVILTVYGEVSDTNRGEVEPGLEPLFERYGMDFEAARSFTFPALSAMEQTEITVTYPEGGAPQMFTGPLVRDVLAAAGTEGDIAIVSAFDGYQREIPVARFEDHDVILALTRDGEPLAIGDFGPAMLVWPRDSDTELAGQKDDDWVWGVFAIEIASE
jgi:hypothetical protein